MTIGQYPDAFGKICRKRALKTVEKIEEKKRCVLREVAA